jgi:hypothetical protein
MAAIPDRIFQYNPGVYAAKWSTNMGWGSGSPKNGPAVAANVIRAPVQAGDAGRFDFDGVSARPVLITNFSGKTMYIKTNNRDASGTWVDASATDFDIRLPNVDPTVDISQHGALNVSSFGIFLPADAVEEDIRLVGWPINQT